MKLRTWFRVASLLTTLLVQSAALVAQIKIELPQIKIDPAENLRNLQKGAEEARRRAEAAAEDAKRKAAQLGQAAGNVAQQGAVNTLNAARKAADDAAATARKAADDAAAAASKAARDADAARRKALEDASNTTKKAAYDAAVAAKKAADETAKTTRKAADDANTAALKADADATNAISKAAGDTAKTTRKAADDATTVARKAGQDAENARRKALSDASNTANKAAYDASVAAKKAADDAARTARKAAEDARVAAIKAGGDAASAAQKAVNDFQNARDKAYDDAVRVGMRALPGDIRKGVQHLGEAAKKEVEKYPIVAGALIAVIKATNPTLAAEIRAALEQSCDAADVVSQLKTEPERGLDRNDKNPAAILTPFKKEGVFGWNITGCRAEAVGTLERDAQHSSDNLWTIDVRLKAFVIDGVNAQPGRFVRIEVEPTGGAHDYCDHNSILKGQTISIGGPVLVDTDGPFLEIHPINDFHVIGSIANAAR